MAPKHKYADASESLTSTLDSDHIAELCEEAARRSETLQALVRLEEAQPGRLVHSVRSRITAGRVELMTFSVTLRDTDGLHHVTTRILRYKVKRQWILVIPLPWQMIAWGIYKGFMYELERNVRVADPMVQTSVIEIAGASFAG